MLLADDGEQSLLYTGDFKLDESATSEPAELPHADILVMESTFGRPHYRLPPRESVVARLLEIVYAALADGKDAGRARLPARQIAGSDEAADPKRRARAAAPRHLRDQPHLRTVRRRPGRLRAYSTAGRSKATPS